MKNIDELKPRAFTKFCMSIGMVPSSYTSALTYEEQLLWFCSYLEKEVIPAVNNNGEAIEELQQLFVQLQEYVEHYFDTLDIQEEVNNKLDDMAESGELTEIIATYLNIKSLLTFDTLADMKTAENIQEGSKVKTFGYYSINDGGGATYYVRQVQNTDTENDMDIVALLDEDLVAEIEKPVSMNVKQFGAKGDNIHNDTENIQRAIDYAVENKINIIVPEGDYLIDHIDIYGETSFKGVAQKKVRFYTTNNINYTNAINISGNSTQVSDFMLIGTSDGDYDSSAHVQNGIGFTTTHENYAGRLDLHNLNIIAFTGSGIYQPSNINSYLADSTFDKIYCYDNEGYGCYLEGNSDFSITNSYFANNRKTGLHFACSNCRLINIKSFLNGVGIYDASLGTQQTRYHGFYLSTYGTIITNCTAQENYGDGFKLENCNKCVFNDNTTDANGILGWTTNPYNLQNHGSTRVARTSGYVTNEYAGFRFKNVEGSIGQGLVGLSFIDTNTYGVQMAYIYYFEGNFSMNFSGVGSVANTSVYNTAFDFGSNIVEINEALLGKYSNYFENKPQWTVSDISTGASTGSFRINIPNWAQGMCMIKLSKGGSLYDYLVIACSRTNNGVVTAKISNQDYYTLTNGSSYVTVNINNGGIYGATIKTIN